MFRSIPSMDKSLQALLHADASLASVPQPLLKELASSFWDKKREEIRGNKTQGPCDLASQLPALLSFVRKGLKNGLHQVLNGTGVIIHTNLGRSILAKEACEAVKIAASGYCNLELNNETGERGSRNEITCSLIRKITGAEDSMVVNNNAAAVLLVLDTLCAGGETIVSRGELVEIGGSFRIPDIMQKSGATLKEVGTTNRTHLEDYQKAINEQTRAIMRVHTSNFRIIGFHAEVELQELKELANKNNLPLIVDLGSGNLVDFGLEGLPREPLVNEVLAQGADIVCFSGDKVLGGPQAGIIAGKAEFVGRLKQNPLARALRCDKLCLAALEATLRLYLDLEKAKKAVPTLAMISQSPASLAKDAQTMAKAIRKAFKNANIACQIKLIRNTSRVGGGSFPECALPTTLVCLYPEKMSAKELKLKLLKADIPLIGRLDKDAFCLDPRTLAKKDYKAVINSLIQAFTCNQGH